MSCTAASFFWKYIRWKLWMSQIPGTMIQSCMENVISNQKLSFCVLAPCTELIHVKTFETPTKIVGRNGRKTDIILISDLVEVLRQLVDLLFGLTLYTAWCTMLQDVRVGAWVGFRGWWVLWPRSLLMLLPAGRESLIRCGMKGFWGQQPRRLQSR